jgi:hypothetical protein
MAKLKTQFNDLVDASSKADLVDGKIPLSQLPSAPEITKVYLQPSDFSVNETKTYDGNNSFFIIGNGSTFPTAWSNKGTIKIVFGNTDELLTNTAIFFQSWFVGSNASNVSITLEIKSSIFKFSGLTSGDYRGGVFAPGVETSQTNNNITINTTTGVATIVMDLNNAKNNTKISFDANGQIDYACER